MDAIDQILYNSYAMYSGFLDDEEIDAEEQALLEAKVDATKESYVNTVAAYDNDAALMETFYAVAGMDLASKYSGAGGSTTTDDTPGNNDSIYTPNQHAKNRDTNKYITKAELTDLLSNMGLEDDNIGNLIYNLQLFISDGTKTLAEVKEKICEICTNDIHTIDSTEMDTIMDNLDGMDEFFLDNYLIGEHDNTRVTDDQVIEMLYSLITQNTVDLMGHMTYLKKQIKTEFDVTTPSIAEVKTFLCNLFSTNHGIVNYEEMGLLMGELDNLEEDPVTLYEKEIYANNAGDIKKNRHLSLSENNGMLHKIYNIPIEKANDETVEGRVYTIILFLVHDKKGSGYGSRKNSAFSTFYNNAISAIKKEFAGNTEQLLEALGVFNEYTEEVFN